MAFLVGLTLEGNALSDFPTLEIMLNGQVVSSSLVYNSASSSYTALFSFDVAGDSTPPSSLTLGFVDNLSEAGRSIDVTGVTLNGIGQNLSNFTSVNGADITASMVALEQNESATLTFTPTSNSGGGTYSGTGGDDVIAADAATHTYDGLAGNDTLDFSGITNGVFARIRSLRADKDNDGVDDTILRNFENLTGSAFADVLFGDDNVNVLNGGDGNDVIRGYAGNDVLFGGDGADELYGYEGDDTINGGDGNDKIYGDEGETDLASGNDTLNGGAGNDIITGGDGNDIINGGADNDLIAGNDGTDTLNGDAGDDIIYGGDGVDTIDGGTGNDILRGDAGADTLNGGADNDTLDGGADNDILNGDGGNDVIYGGDGDDTLDGGTGNNRLFGEGGNDTFVVDSGGINEFHGGSGTDTLDYSANLTGIEARFTSNALDDNMDGTFETIFSSIENLILTNQRDIIRADANDNVLDGRGGNDSIWGFDGADTLTGGAGHDALYGGSGIDTLNGDDGQDFLYGGTGNDIVNGGADNDRLYGEDGDDTINGGTGNDFLYGGNNNDTLNGGDNDDRIYGGEGADILNGDAGIDRIWGGNGNDTIRGGDGIDLLYGEGGDDTIYADADSAVLSGGDGNDTLWGSSTFDQLYGNSGNDILNAGDGDDLLKGHDGTDTLNAEGGNDTLIYSDSVDTFNGGTGTDTLTIEEDNTAAIGIFASNLARFNGIDIIDMTNFNGRFAANVLSVDVADVNSISDTNTLYVAGDDGLDTATVRNLADGHFVQAWHYDGGIYEQYFQNGNFISVEIGIGTGTASNYANPGILGTTGAETIAGTGNGEAIVALEGNDTVNAGGGDDDVYGNDGNDTLNGDGGNDTLIGGDGTDTLNGGADNDVLIGGDGGDILNGDGGADILHGSGLTQAEIQAILDASSGDIVYNQASNSFYQFVNANVNFAAAEAAAAAATLNGTAGHLVTITSDAENTFVASIINDNSWHSGNDSANNTDWVWGAGLEAGVQFSSGATATNNLFENWDGGQPQNNSEHNALIYTNGSWHDWPDTSTHSYVIEWEAGLFSDDNAADTLNGGAGSDHLYGYGGNDILDGGADGDLIFGGAGADTITGGTGDDTIVISSTDFAVGETIDGGGDTDTLILTNAMTIDFSAGAITSIEILDGSEGNDTVTMSATQFAGFTTIDLDGGTDVLNVQATGTEDISGLGLPTVTDVETGNLTGSAGNDDLTLTGAQLDAIVSGSGTIAFGGGASDVLNITSTSADLNTLGTTDGSITGLEEINASTAGAGVTIDVTGQTENLIIVGGASADTIDSGAGDDTITGGNGDNVINAGGGDDTVTGGNNNDTLNASLAGSISVGRTVADILADNPGVVYDAGTGNFYQYISTGANYATAKANAAAATLEGTGGHLATITSAAEQTFVWGLTGNTSVWGAGTDSVTEGAWLWDDGPENGTQFWSGGPGGSPVGGEYNNWIPGSEPWNGNAAFDYFILRAANGGQWWTEQATSTFDYVIEWEGAGLTSSGGVLTGYDSRGETNVLNGGAGNDTLNGSMGADTLNGDAGNDTINSGSVLSTDILDILGADPNAILTTTGEIFHLYTSGATFTAPVGVTSVDYLVVGGGGGGGGFVSGNTGGGGGGGAGEVVEVNGYAVTAGNNYAVVVGSGGSGGVGGSSMAGTGGTSSFDGNTAVGGGGGGTNGVNNNGANGASGGGGRLTGTGGTGSAGNDGGDGSGATTATAAAGGGGGAGTAGSNATGNNGGDGGDGVTSSITGVSTYFGGGGGGGAYIGSGSGGDGGLGGGGDAPDTRAAGGDGADGFGGGGGGATGSNGTGAFNGGDGGDGVVIVSYSVTAPDSTIIAGGTGNDDLYGSTGQDIFDFDHVGAGNTDDIFNFNIQVDKIDLSDLLTGYDPLTEVITDFVQITDSGGNSEIRVDTTGSGSFGAATVVATVDGVTGLTDEVSLEMTGIIIV